MAKEKFFYTVLQCGFCANKSHMKNLGEIQDFENSIYNDGACEEGVYYNVLKCPACSKINIISYYWNASMEENDELIIEMKYPIDNKIPVGLPSNILIAYKAAEKVKTIDVNAYVILLRRLLELVCIDRSAKGETLALMLKDLSVRHEIPEKLVKVAYGLKDFGNIGAHAGTGSLSQEEIPIATALASALLEYIYSAPYLASKAESKLELIKRKTIS